MTCKFHAELLAGDTLGLTLAGRVGGEGLQRRMPLGGLAHPRACFRPVGLVGRAHVHRQQLALAVHRDVAGRMGEDE
ncbi:MAG: hypothetical protein INR62_03435 [Rhodospirillales bacterium]|nr:hypothetical protein [Acetobacter sp.]